MRGLGRASTTGRVTPQSVGVVAPYTPAVTWIGSTLGSIVGQSTRLSGLLIVSVSFAVTVAGGANTLTIPFPAGIAASMAGFGATNAGTGTMTFAAAATSAAFAATPAVTTYYFQALIPLSS